MFRSNDVNHLDPARESKSSDTLGIGYASFTVRVFNLL